MPALPAGDAGPPRAGRALPRRAASSSSAIAVQETSPADIRAYAERYDLDYTIGFDASGHIFREYKVFGLPTQFFIGPDGVIASVGKTVDEAAAVAAIEAILP